METWREFFVAMAGAAAALTGLIFVGISISLERILALPSLPKRAALALVLLMGVLVVSTLCLAPGTTMHLGGIEILVCGLVLWGYSTLADISILSKSKPEFKKVGYLNFFLSQLATVPYIGAGIFTLCCGETGLYWLVPAFIFSFVKSVLDAWVLLIEIHR